jgi:hypothetical protein
MEDVERTLAELPVKDGQSKNLDAESFEVQADKWLSGECCSQYGYCGKSEAHCGAGCQSNCGNTATTTTSTPAPSGTPPVSKDGRCGKDFGNAVCTGWPLGECCSEYGYCGGTSAVSDIHEPGVNFILMRN